MLTKCHINKKRIDFLAPTNPCVYDNKKIIKIVGLK